MKGDVERHLDSAFPPLDCLVDMDLISLLRHVSIEGLGASHIDPLAIQNLGVVASEVRIPPPKFLDLHSLGFPHDGVVRHGPDLYVSAVICLSDSSVGDIRDSHCQHRMVCIDLLPMQLPSSFRMAFGSSRIGRISSDPAIFTRRFSM